MFDCDYHRLNKIKIVLTLTVFLAVLSYLHSLAHVTLSAALRIIKHQPSYANGHESDKGDRDEQDCHTGHGYRGGVVVILLLFYLLNENALVAGLMTDSKFLKLSNCNVMLVH